MSGQTDAQPIIIKRKKKGGGDGHHGGAWKVAYADFVTAMMAFFMLMWLLNATTEKQRTGIADYFSPTIPINRVSGGGSGAFGGNSIFTEESLAQNGTGATSENPTEANKARGQTGTSDDGGQGDTAEEVFESAEKELVGKGGESDVMENALKHIVTEVTDEGLVFHIYALEGAPLFEEGGARPTPVLRTAARMVSESIKIASNPVSIGGHLAARPVVLADNPAWELSTARGMTMRRLMENSGTDYRRIEQVSGHAAREPLRENPMSVENNRLEIILLRE